MDCLLQALGEMAAYAQAHPFATAAAAAVLSAWLLSSDSRPY